MKTPGSLGPAGAVLASVSGPVQSLPQPLRDHLVRLGIKDPRQVEMTLNYDTGPAGEPGETWLVLLPGRLLVFAREPLEIFDLLHSFTRDEIREAAVGETFVGELLLRFACKKESVPVVLRVPGLKKAAWPELIERLRRGLIPALQVIDRALVRLEGETLVTERQSQVTQDMDEFPLLWSGFAPIKIDEGLGISQTDFFTAGSQQQVGGDLVDTMADLARQSGVTVDVSSVDDGSAVGETAPSRSRWAGGKKPAPGASRPAPTRPASTRPAPTRPAPTRPAETGSDRDRRASMETPDDIDVLVVDEEGQAPAGNRCPRCLTPNPPESRSCRKCGKTLPEAGAKEAAGSGRSGVPAGQTPVPASRAGKPASGSGGGRRQKPAGEGLDVSSALHNEPDENQPNPTDDTGCLGCLTNLIIIVLLLYILGHFLR